MDIGRPINYKDFSKEQTTNERFIQYLDSRLIDLQEQGAKIIEVNYSSQTHHLLTVNFDCSTIEKAELYKYIKENNIVELIYTGFHYPVCITETRPLSAYNTVRNRDLENVSIAIQLTRSTTGFFKMPLHDTVSHGVQQIML